MTLTGTDFYRAYRPSECDLRLWLHHHRVKPADPGPFEEVIRRLGERHERARPTVLGDALNLSEGTLDERHRRALEAIRAGTQIIYQPVFMATVCLGGRDCAVTGIPDFLIRESNGYVIHDVKMSLRITESAHPEILWQLRFYGLLFEIATGTAPLRLEVINGQGAIVLVDPVPAATVEDQLARLRDVVEATQAPFEPVATINSLGAFRPMVCRAGRRY